MTKRRTMQLAGEVIESLSNTNYRVRLGNNHLVLAYVSGRMRMNYIKILPGDRVTVEMTAYDPTRARIIFRAKNPT